VKLHRTALLLLMGLAASAAAQDTDQRQMAADDGPIWNLAADAEYLSAVRAYGECAARDVQVNSRHVLRDLPGSKQSNQSLFWMLLGSNSCADNGRTPNALPAAYRGVVAEYMLERDFELPSFARKHSAVRVFSEQKVGDLSALSGEAAMALPYIMIGSCLAKSDPAGLSVLFSSAPSSDEEAAAFAALERNTARCSRDDAQPIVNLFQLRGYLAEGAYRHGVAAAGGTSGA
jgi:hypothetical protein